MTRHFITLVCLSLAAPVGTLLFAADQTVEFNRDIRPILSDNCFACHGPDEKTRQAGLRLDVAEQAKMKLASGAMALVPGKLGESELARRIVAADPTEQMPPADSGKTLTVRQIELLKRWIEQGAEYQPHWSFVAPKRPGIPPVGWALLPVHSSEAEDRTGKSAHPTERVEWPRNAIDNFVLARLQREGLAPSPTTEKERLIRRVTLDLTGVPPTIGEVEEFLSDTAPDSYEQLIDRLLASPRYGERMTLDWLDAARYADTHGFNNDTTRYMWRWRDWTINAFNSGMPFDQFVTEQLAGDLLSNPTLDQRIATGFNRNHVINSEGGIIPEEYRVEYVADRVHTTATILMGLSLGCARCHDHKFDPLTQREYYQFFAFFNQLNEQGEAGRVGNAEPTIKAPTPEQLSRQTALSKQLASLDDTLKQSITRATETMPEWEPKLPAERSVHDLDFGERTRRAARSDTQRPNRRKGRVGGGQTRRSAQVRREHARRSGRPRELRSDGQVFIRGVGQRRGQGCGDSPLAHGRRGGPSRLRPAAGRRKFDGTSCPPLAGRSAARRVEDRSLGRQVDARLRDVRRFIQGRGLQTLHRRQARGR